MSVTLPATTIMNAVSCTGGDSPSTATCVAVGTNTTTPSTPQPIVAQTTNGGVSWSRATVNSIPGAGARLQGVSCTSISPTAPYCVAAGSSSTGPFLISNTGAAGSWNNISSVAPGGTGHLTSVACTGSGGSDTVCVVGSGDPIVSVEKETLRAPLVLLVTQNGGTSWSNNVPGGFADSSQLVAASCAGSGLTAKCVMVGYNPSLEPILLTSNNAGSTWYNQVGSIFGLPSSAVLSGVSCTPFQGGALCIVGGGDITTNPQTPVLVVGFPDNFWVYKTAAIDTIPDGGFFVGAGTAGGPTSSMNATAQ